jgi:hypothetical protein
MASRTCGAIMQPNHAASDKSVGMKVEATEEKKRT